MSSPGRTIKKASKRSTPQTKKMQCPSSSTGASDALETSPTTPQAIKRTDDKSKASGNPRRRLDFSKLDTRAITASANVSASSIGALTRVIEDNALSGKLRGSVSVSLLVLSTSLKTTRNGSKYVLFVDETGCIPTRKKQPCKMLSRQVRIEGKVNYQPSSTNDEERFMALDWNATLETIPVVFTKDCSNRIPTSLNALLYTASVDLNAGFACPVVMADLVTSQVDHKKKEVTMSLLDCTGYAFITVTNAPSQIRVDVEDPDEEVGPVIIAGHLEFKPVQDMMVDGVAIIVEYNHCYIQAVNRRILDQHNQTISSIAKKDFQFEEPFLASN